MTQEGLEIKLAKLESSIEYIKESVDKIAGVLKDLPNCYLSKESFEYEKKEIANTIKRSELKTDSRLKNIERLIKSIAGITAVIIAKIAYDLLSLIVHVIIK